MFYFFIVYERIDFLTQKIKYDITKFNNHLNHPLILVTTLPMNDFFDFCCFS